MNPAQEIANDLNAIAALNDWLGDGGRPVHPILAEMRAERCVAGNDGAPCPRNKEPNWWDRVKSVIAEWIRAELVIKNRMALSVSHEDGLNMCAACGCCLKLKVWVPRHHVRAHTKPEHLEKMPSYCWIKKELA